MTRKRFCKLLMGHGISRNEANMIAANRPRELSFEIYALSPAVVWRRINCGITLMFKTAFNRTWDKAAEAAKELCRAFYGVPREGSHDE